MTVRELVQIVDQWTILEARVKALTSDANDFATAWAGVRDIAFVTGNTLENTVSSFAKVSLIKDEIGLSTQEALEFVETVQKIGFVGGSTTAQVARGMNQLTEAIAKGKFEWVDFRSLIVNTPMVASELAKGLDMTVEQLQRAIREGTILRDDIIGGILSRTEAINEQVRTFPVTISFGLSQFKLAMEELIVTMDNVWGISEFIGKSLMELAASMRAHAQALETEGAQGLLNQMTGIRSEIEALEKDLTERLTRIREKAAERGTTEQLGQSELRTIDRINELYKELNTAQTDYIKLRKTASTEATEFRNKMEETLFTVEAMVEAGYTEQDVLNQMLQKEQQMINAKASKLEIETEMVSWMERFIKFQELAAIRDAKAVTTSKNKIKNQKTINEQIDEQLQKGKLWGDRMKEFEAAQKIVVDLVDDEIEARDGALNSAQTMETVLSKIDDATLGTLGHSTKTKEELEKMSELDRDILDTELKKLGTEQARLILQERLTKELEKQQKAGKEILDNLDKEIRQLRFRLEYGDDIADREEEVERLMEGRISLNETILRQKLAERDLLEDQVAAQRAAVEEYERIWTRAWENIQDSFGDTIHRMLWEDGIDSFEDFFDSILDAFKRMLSEMIAAWITNFLKNLVVPGLGDIFKGVPILGDILGLGSKGPGGAVGTAITGGVLAKYGLGGGGGAAGAAGAVGAVGAAGAAAPALAVGGAGEAALGFALAPAPVLPGAGGLWGIPGVGAGVTGTSAVGGATAFGLGPGGVGTGGLISGSPLGPGVIANVENATLFAGESAAQGFTQGFGGFLSNPAVWGPAIGFGGLALIHAFGKSNIPPLAELYKNVTPEMFQDIPGTGVSATSVNRFGEPFDVPRGREIGFFQGLPERFGDQRFAGMGGEDVLQMEDAIIVLERFDDQMAGTVQKAIMGFKRMSDGTLALGRDAGEVAEGLKSMVPITEIGADMAALVTDMENTVVGWVNLFDQGAQEIGQKMQLIVDESGQMRLQLSGDILEWADFLAEKTGMATVEVVAALQQMADQGVVSFDSMMIGARYTWDEIVAATGTATDAVAAEWQAMSTTGQSEFGKLGDVAQITFDQVGNAGTTNLNRINSTAITTFTNMSNSAVGAGNVIEGEFNGTTRSVVGNLNTVGSRGTSAFSNLGRVAVGSANDIGRVTDETWDLQRAIFGVPTNRTITFNIRTRGDIPAFQHGGSFIVQGAPGPDRNLIMMRASRGEQVDVTPPGRGDSGESGGRSTREMLNKLTSIETAVVDSNKRLLSALRGGR
jgi:tape measure domain-containing protein